MVLTLECRGDLKGYIHARIQKIFSGGGGGGGGANSQKGSDGKFQHGKN